MVGELIVRFFVIVGLNALVAVAAAPEIGPNTAVLFGVMSTMLCLSFAVLCQIRDIMDA